MGTYITVGGAQQGAVAGDCDRGDGDVVLGDQLMGTVVLGKVPDSYTAASITADDLALVGVDDDVGGWAAVVVGALDSTRARFPDLDSAILGARHHPFSLAVESYARDIARVAFKDE